MKRLLMALLFLVAGASVASAQNFSVSGTVTGKTSGAPVEFATVVIESSGQWAVADAKGVFKISSVQPGEAVLSVSCLGYVTETMKINVAKDVKDLKFILKDDNLALDGAVVTAQEKDNSATTSRLIDKTALDHVQVMNVADISSLLPGGSTSNPLLTSNQQFNIRSGASEGGNSSFGTAVEIDGVRLSGNASFADYDGSSTVLKGVSTNNIASSNIESVEVITGVPSVEYGDMTSGVVKINTKKGKTPYTVTMSTSPNTKQLSMSKGFGLGNGRSGASRGVLNTNLEYARSISNQMSPYTSYDRNQLSLVYSNTFSRGFLSSTPLRFSTSVTGNVGGLDNAADPDRMLETFTVTRDNVLRGNITADLLLSKSWITNVEMNASASYSDKMTRTNSFYSSSLSTAVLHQTEEGYYMADMLEPGYWYNTMVTDDKPVTAKITLKANWAKNIGKANNKLKIGSDWSLDKNLGQGLYSENPATAPTYREYPYCDIPAMTNLAGYIEDNLMLPVGADGRLNLIAGVRSDNTMIPGSAYGTTSSLSPRFNAKYTVFSSKGREEKLLRELGIRASWGEAVKLPSYSILYPTPSYIDVNVFTSTASADNRLSRAYYVLPRTIEYNSGLRWQRNIQSEVGVDFDIAGNKVSLAGYYNRTHDAYRLVTGYENISYAYTATANVQGISIPAADRVYSVNPSDGSIVVSDRTGTLGDQTIPNITRHQYQTKMTEDNDDSPITRAGVEWVIDFKRIQSINTTVRIDGSYYSYRSIYTDMKPYSPYTISSADGTPYKYVGWYYGGNSWSNGSLTRNIKTNLTLTTNIPQVRMVVSMKVESSLYRFSQALSERDGAERSHVVTSQSEILSVTGESIYDGDHYTVTYPDYYVSYDDSEPKNYLESLKWAKENDPALYSDLSKLAMTSSQLYNFKSDRISPYFSANFSVTKEIGDMTSISFYANNFFNNMMKIYSSKTGTYTTGSTSYIPKFYYGLTVRLKF